MSSFLERTAVIALFLNRRWSGSVHVALVAALTPEVGDVGRGVLRRAPAYLGDDPVQRGVDVPRHALLVAADVEVRAVLQPGEQVAAALPHPVLDVDLLRLVAREGDVDPGERAVL